MEQDLFHVKTDTFEGPLDLLLTLIEKRKLLINDIALAAVTDDYIAYLDRSDQIPLSQTAHFILVAATLLLIKSKSLLPVLELTQEEQHDIEDLERRLKLYQLFKELAGGVRTRFGTTPLYERQVACDQTPLFAPDAHTTLPEIATAVANVLQQLPKKETTPQAVVKKVISLEEMIDRLGTRVQTSVRLSFKEFSGSAADRVTVIVTFLAMLELVKQGSIEVRQDAHFSDIVMETEQMGLPRYT